MFTCSMRLVYVCLPRALSQAQLECGRMMARVTDRTSKITATRGSTWCISISRIHSTSKSFLENFFCINIACEARQQEYPALVQEVSPTKRVPEGLGLRLSRALYEHLCL